MQSRRGLLCVGTEQDSLQTRCAVLSHSGYDAKSATLAEAEILLRTQVFGLVIVSVWLGERERDLILAAARKTPVLILTELTFADDLLAQVALALQASRLRAASAS